MSDRKSTRDGRSAAWHRASVSGRRPTLYNELPDGGL